MLLAMSAGGGVAGGAMAGRGRGTGGVWKEPAILGGGLSQPLRCLSCAAMNGLHLTADLRHCAPGNPALTDADALRQLCLRAVADNGLQAVGELFHRFPEPGGVTGVVLLAESHLAVHTWPELGVVTLDVYVCNLHGDHSAKAEALMARLQDTFAATQVERHRLVRGAARAS